MPFLTSLPRHPNQGENPYYAVIEAWMDGIELNLDELESHAETHDALASHLPTGGATGQVLIKNSNTNFDVIWGAGGGGGVTDHGALTGLTDADHPISAVTGLQAALDGKSGTGHTHSYEPIGTAAAEVNAHEALGDPHSQYLTPAEASAAYAAIAAAVPTGGTTGQVLKKTGGADYAMAWGTDESGGGGAVSPLTLTANSDAERPLMVKAFSATQSANLFEARLSDNTLFWAVTPDQRVRLGPNVGAQDATVKVGVAALDLTGLLIKGFAGQTAKFASFTDSSNVEKFGVTANGTVNGLNIGGAFGIVGAVILDAAEAVPTGLPSGTLIMRRPA